MSSARKEEKEAKERIVDSLVGVSEAKDALAEALALKMKKSLGVLKLSEAVRAAVFVAKGAHKAGDDALAKEMISFVETSLVRLRELQDAYAGIDEVVDAAASHFNGAQKEAEVLIRETEAKIARLHFAKSLET